MEQKFEDDEPIEEILGGVVLRGNIFDTIEKIREAHKGAKVTIMCRSKDDEAKCRVLATVAGLEIEDVIIEEDEKPLPRGKCIISLNPDIMKVEEATQRLEEAFAQVYTKKEEELKVEEASIIDEKITAYERAYQREQIKQRSRYLSKHCRK